MGRGVGLVARLTHPQVQEQAAAFSGAPLDYKGRIGLDLTLLDVERLETALEAGGFELANSRVHQNLVLHHLGCSMCHSVVLLHELCHMVGSPYRPTDHCEISWQDLQWVELQGQAGEILVCEEIVESESGVLSMVVLPNPVPDDEDMEDSEQESEESISLANI